MKMKKYLWIFAALFTAAIGFTACSSDDDLANAEEEQPTLGDAIKAQFTISIPTEPKATTRQSAYTVNNNQSITDFRGITFIKLYPSALLPGKFTDDNTVTGSGTNFIGKNIALTNLIIPTPTPVSNYIPDKTLLGTNNSVLYGDVQLQIGTRTFLFYGMAIGKKKDGTFKPWNATPESYDWEEKSINGFLNQAGLDDQPGDVSNVIFSPDPITTNTNSDTKRNAIITYLNAIANAIAGTESWSTSENLGFQTLYNSFTSMKAGSSTNLQVAIKDLYFALKDNTDPLAIAICDCIKNTEISTGVKYVTIDEGEGTLTFNDAIAGYPLASDHLPDGAAVLSWDATNKFSYATANVSTSEMTVTNLESYVYPACLYYWGKSGILTSEDSKSDLYVDTKTWAEIANATNFKDGNAITQKTRSVVLTEPIQYAVGRFDISVVPAASSTSSTALATLTDAGKGSNAKDVDVSKLKLTGILIGGQKAVDWKFTPISTSAESTIYDNIEVSQQAAGGLALQSDHNTVLNHTLVLESAGKVGDVEDEIKVALEFVNNDQDFLGADGIVPVGTKFYLVGALKAGDYKTQVGYTATGGKVFKQDYITRAKFTIANLKSAINTIPDLRNPKVELGLSVDLTWQTGITFDITIN